LNLLWFPLALALVQAPSAGPPTIEANPSTSNVSIGERLQVTVQARGSSTTTYEFPKEINTGSIDLRLSRPVNRMASTAVYEAQVFALGADARIPPIEVHYTLQDGTEGSAASPEVPLNVISSLDPNEENPQPADFAPPVPVLVSRAFWVAAGLAALGLAAGLVALFRRLRFPRKPVDPRVIPAVTPEEEALSGLAALESGKSVMEARAFYIQLSQILKQYLERRLNAPVLEMTSTETLAFVKNHSWTSPHAVGLRDLVTAADLVKFGGSSDVSNADRQLQVAREIVGRIDRLRRAEARAAMPDKDQRKTA